MEVGADAKAFEVSSGSPFLRTIFQKQQWGQQRVYWKAEAARQEGKHHLSETMGMPLFHLGGTLLLILAEAHGVLEPPGHQSRGEWVQRLVTLGLQSGGCWGEGHAPCAWLFGKSIVLLLLTKSQATCKSGWNLQLVWLTGSFVSQAPQCFPLHPAHRLGTAPMPDWVEANSSVRVLSLQYAELNSCIISIRDNLGTDPMR